MTTAVSTVLREVLHRRQQQEGLAIVGIGLRFPGADGIDEFWSNLIEGVDSVIEQPCEEVRGTLLPIAPDHEGDVAQRTSNHGGYLKHLDMFDARFFGLSKLEAEQLDPQQRILLQVAVESLDDAGIPLESIRGSRTGVYLGVCHSDFADLQMSLAAHPNLYTNTGSALSIAANRLSYFLDARGPSMAVDTACSASLVAVNIAERQLREREIDLALVGGSNLILNQKITEGFRTLFALSPRSACRSFDASADGFVRSEGVAFVVLKRASDARRDGDRIYAIVAASSVNNDGATNGLTAPSQSAQCEVIRSALDKAMIAPEDVSFVEAHGSGTQLGDAIELGALNAVFGTGRSRDLWVGSVKSNLGHMEAAAGIGGLIKAALSLHHGRIPPSIHFSVPNQAISGDDCRLKVPTSPIEIASARTPSYCGVSSFGLGGTNAHVILRSEPLVAPAPATENGGGVVQLVLLSASCRAALRYKASTLLERINGAGDIDLPALARASQARQSHHPSRLVLLAIDGSDLAKQLASFIQLEDPDTGSQPPIGNRARGRAPRVALSHSVATGTESELARDLCLGLRGLLPDIHQAGLADGDVDQLMSAQGFAHAEIAVHVHQSSQGLTFSCARIGGALGELRSFDPRCGTDLDVMVLQLASEAYKLGASVNWRKRITRSEHTSLLPNYAWQGRRFWPTALA